MEKNRRKKKRNTNQDPGTQSRKNVTRQPYNKNYVPRGMRTTHGMDPRSERGDGIADWRALTSVPRRQGLRRAARGWREFWTQGCWMRKGLSGAEGKLGARMCALWRDRVSHDTMTHPSYSTVAAPRSVRPDATGWGSIMRSEPFEGKCYPLSAPPRPQRNRTYLGIISPGLREVKFSAADICIKGLICPFHRVEKFRSSPDFPRGFEPRFACVILTLDIRNWENGIRIRNFRWWKNFAPQLGVEII